jgi:serine/threonine-protein kinase
MSGATEVAIGTVVAQRYRIEAAIGEGGFGGVYRSVNLQTGEAVALKMLHARHAARENEVKRFQREAALVTRLDHPNIVKTLDYGHTTDGTPFIAFDLLEGISLREKLASEGALSTSRAGRIVMQVLQALEHAHGFGVVHRDIKPANIFLCAGRDDDFVRVLDFGIAKALIPDDTNLTQLTGTGQFIGTPAYMSPEQIKGMSIGANSDLYSLGLVLAELVTGKKVAHAEAEIDLLMTHLSPAPLALTEAVLESPFADVIRRSTEKDPSARFPTASEMYAAIDAVMRQRAPASAPGHTTAALPATSLVPTLPPAQPVSVSQPISITQPAAPATMPMPQPYHAAPGPIPPPSKSSKALLIALPLVVLAGAGGAFLWWQARSASERESKTTASAGAAPKPKLQESIAAEALTASAAPAPPPRSTTENAVALPASSLTSAEIKKRLVAVGWTILPTSTIDQRVTGAVSSTFMIEKSELKGIVQLQVYDHEGDAAAHFRSVDGHVPRDTRMGRDGRFMLVVQVLANGAEAASLVEKLTSSTAPP